MKGLLLPFNLKLNCLIFSTSLNSSLMDIYCKLSKGIGQTLCSYEHYIVYLFVICHTFAHCGHIVLCQSSKSLSLALFSALMLGVVWYACNNSATAVSQKFYFQCLA